MADCLTILGLLLGFAILAQPARSRRDRNAPVSQARAARAVGFLCVCVAALLQFHEFGLFMGAVRWLGIAAPSAAAITLARGYLIRI